MFDTLKLAPRRLLPDTLLPSQFFVTLRSQTPPKPPEYRLLIAVLEDAVECFQKYLGTTGQAERQLFREAEQWIMGGNEQHDKRLDAQALAFSFRYVCEALGIEPDYMRRGLQHWRDRQLAKRHSRPGSGSDWQKGNNAWRRSPADDRS